MGSSRDGVACREGRATTPPYIQLPVRPGIFIGGAGGKGWRQAELTAWAITLMGHSDLVFPEPLEDLPEVTRPPLPTERELLGLTQSSQWGRGLGSCWRDGQGTQGRGAVPIT